MAARLTGKFFYRKWHAFHGTMYSLFLMEVMEDALLELVAEEAQDPKVLYQNLLEEEYNNFEYFETKASIKYGDQWSTDVLEAEHLYRDPAYCHTAVLPSQARYLGHTMNHESYSDWFDYYKGYPLSKAEKHPKEEIRLSYVPKQREHKCDVPLNIDHPSFFLASNAYNDWQKVTIPNPTEVQVYGMHPMSGIIMVCTAACSFDCGGSPLLQPDALNKENRARFRVNGEDVGSVERFDNCYLLKRPNGALHWAGGRYEIEVHTLLPGKRFEFTSFIVW